MQTVSSLIGHTPLIQLSEKLYAKFEAVNPSGSIKDRMARYILDRAEERGELQPGAAIIEATSGNTGIAFSMLAAERGYHMIVVMPSDMSDERKKMIRAFGAEVMEVGPSDFVGAVATADALAIERKGYRPQQFKNPDNILAHKETTGAEILTAVQALSGQPHVAAFVSGIGTGGTLMGVRAALSAAFPNIHTVAVEVEGAVVLNGQTPRNPTHPVQGISDGFVPDIVDISYINDVIIVDPEKALARARRLASEQGLLVGNSSGAHVLAAEEYIAKYSPDGIVVTTLPDRRERYLSMHD